MARWLLPIVMLWAVCGGVSAGIFHDSDLNWRTIESAHFRIHYHNGEEKIAQRFVPKAEQVYVKSCAFLNWYPKDKTDVVLTDEYDLSNGYTRVFPYNSIVLFLAAPDAINSLEEYDDWLTLVFRHEFLHVVHLDKVHGVPRGFQHVFGRHPLLFPNAYQPRWVIEGLATYAETDKQRKVGRGQSAYFDMLMRTETLNGFKQIRRINQPISSWPAGAVPYLYGVFFFEFVHDKYGEQAIKQMVDNYSDNLIPFRINSNSVSVFREQLPELWNEYEAWLKQKYMPVADKVSKAGIRKGEDLTSVGYRAGPLQTLGDKIYFYQFSGEHHATINMIEGKTPAKKLLEVNQNTRFSVNKAQGLLITQPDLCRNARLYYDIYRADADGSHFERLTHCARYRNAVWTGKGNHIVGVHDELGNNRLDLLDVKGQRIETLWQGKDKTQIGQMTSSEHQPYLVASVWRPGKGWNLEKFDLEDKRWSAITHDHAIEAQPQFTPDGKYILYTADSGGIYNIYQYDLARGKIEKMTNVISGAFYPALAGDSLAYISYGIHGFNVAAMSEPTLTGVASSGEAVQTTQTEQGQKNESQATTADNVETKGADVVPLKDDQTKPQIATAKDLPSHAYSPWSSLMPRYWTPAFQVDDQRTELGLATSGTDVLQRHQYAATFLYDFKNKIPLGSLDYIYDGLWPILHVGFLRENDFYVDSNSNPIRIRAKDQGVLEAIVPFLSLEHNWLVHMALISQTDHDVWNKGTSPLPDARDDLAALALRYVSAKRYPLSVSRSDGRDVRLIYEDSDRFGDSLNKGQISVGDWREFIPLWGEHVLALRLVEGHGKHNPSPFRLGGIQTDNSVLSVIMNGQVDTLFNKRDYSLRGYSEGHAQLSGKNVRLISAEYRFPISRIEHGWMVPPFGFNQLHGTIFYDAGGVWNTGTGPAHYYTGAGFELNADLDIFYNIRLRTTLGFAKGFDKTLGENKVYLRIGSEF